MFLSSQKEDYLSMQLRQGSNYPRQVTVRLPLDSPRCLRAESPGESKNNIILKERAKKLY